MHTKKTNNTNKLMQISYHFTLTKIKKLQKLKNNNNNNNNNNVFSCTGQYTWYRPICPILLEIDRYSQYMADTASIFSGTKHGG